MLSLQRITFSDPFLLCTSPPDMQVVGCLVRAPWIPQGKDLFLPSPVSPGSTGMREDASSENILAVPPPNHVPSHSCVITQPSGSEANTEIRTTIDCILPRKNIIYPDLLTTTTWCSHTPVRIDSSIAPVAPPRVARSTKADVVVPTAHHVFQPKLALYTPEATSIALTAGGVITGVQHTLPGD